MQEKMDTVKQRLKESRDFHKSYSNAKRIDRNFEEGREIFTRVRPYNSSFRFGKGENLSPRFVGSFKILERIRLVAYKLELSFHPRKMHTVFHVSMHRKNVPNSSHVLKFEKLQIS